MMGSTAEVTTAFVETTVLTDFLLKRDGSQTAAAGTFSLFGSTLIPHFSWKEFKRGPLKNFIWTHNKLAETQSFRQTLLALQRISRTPRGYLTSTAIEALHSAFVAGFSGVPIGDLVARYGTAADMDHIHADVLRLELKKVIFSSWGKRKALFGGHVQTLTCYPDDDLTEKKNRIEIGLKDCPKGIECCLKNALLIRRSQLATARSAVRDGSARKEIVRRYKVLRRLEKHPTSGMDRDDCRDLGDAYFVLFCPEGATILTTNMRDILPMANALGVPVSRPAPTNS